MTQECRNVVLIKKIDEEQRVVLGEVYAPNVLDTFAEFVTQDDVELMAHRFMQLQLGETIDTNHDNIPNGSHPVESFIARGHPDFTEGAWVLGVKVHDDHIWRQVKAGELNGFSFEALVKPVEMIVQLQVLRDHIGVTEPANNDPEGHRHVFFVQVNDTGRVVMGHTDEVEGHTHRITRATSTEPGGSDRHKHRFFL